MARKLLAMLICACVLTGAPSCSKQDGIVAPSPDVSVEESNNNDIAMQTPPTPTHPAAPEENPPEDETIGVEAENLRKLCKVWGFVKYTHPAFLSGEKDWDEELLALIPTIQSAAEDEVNDILYDWFISLGDDGYDGHSSSYDEQRIRTMTDMTWIADESYLGSQLSSALARFREIPNLYASETLFYYNGGIGTFRNEKQYLGMFGYGIGTAEIENGYRLLGLFRLWNAFEYYFPYKDIMDEDWNELLIEFIPKMMEGTDYQSYCLTLSALGAKTQDAHVVFSNQTSIMTSRFGNYAIPVVLESAEGQIVVRSIVGADSDTCPLQPGDVVTEIDGVDIGEIIAERVQYIAIPNGEKIRSVLPYLPLCTNRAPSVTVLRDGVSMSSTVGTVRWIYRNYYDYSYNRRPVKSHDLLDRNIGLINPSQLNTNNVHAVMEEFSTTSGLVIDLRQYPQWIVYPLAEYLLDERKQFAIMSQAFVQVPGLFLDNELLSAGPSTRMSEGSKSTYYYENPVVILMNQYSQSRCEFTIMALRIGPNVTVIGSNSIGADGNIGSLLLPCGNRVSFTSMGVYTPEGGQTQRIGLSPDIYVESTIEGIRDGRDELMEAAVALILGQ